MDNQMAVGDVEIDLLSPGGTISTKIHHSDFQNEKITSLTTEESKNKTSPYIIASLSPVNGPKHKNKRRKRKSGSKKHRAGKNQKRKYVPYHKKTPEEKLKADELSKKRGNRYREFLKSCGVPLAPHNTNQFLFADSILKDEIDDFDRFWYREGPSTNDLIEEYLSLEDEVQFWEKVKVIKSEMRMLSEEIEELNKLNAELEKLVEKKGHPLEKDFSSLDIGSLK